MLLFGRFFAIDVHLGCPILGGLGVGGQKSNHAKRTGLLIEKPMASVRVKYH